MLKFTPCIGFQGQCSEAIELYKKAFDAKVRELVLYSQADPKDFQYKEAEKDFVYYAEIMIGRQRVSLGDDSLGLLEEGDQEKSNQIDFLIEFDSEEALNTAYKILSDGAKIMTPMTSTTYCTAYVVLKDKFGIPWQLMSGYSR